ncbi:MAG: hypothetical protein RR904_05285 [Bacilli bacterium]
MNTDIFYLVPNYKGSGLIFPFEVPDNYSNFRCGFFILNDFYKNNKVFHFYIKNNDNFEKINFYKEKNNILIANINNQEIRFKILKYKYKYTGNSVFFLDKYFLNIFPENLEIFDKISYENIIFIGNGGYDFFERDLIKDLE